MKKIAKIDYLKYWHKAVALEKLTMDPWQDKVMAHHGHFVLRTGRQVGKSKITSRKGTKLSIEYPKTETLVIAASQRQSSYIFEKMMWIYNKIDELLLIDAKKTYKKEWTITKGRRDLIGQFNMKYGFFIERPTRTKAMLKNGSTIYCLPAGKTGVYLRCFTIDFLIGDEAAYIPEPVFVAVKPMLAVSRKLRGLGWEMYLSTPFGKGGYFYECCHDDDFLQIHVSSEDCERIPRDFLRKERQKLSRIEYAQEYLGEFIDEFNQLFPTQLIKARMTFIEWDKKQYRDRKYYLGVDVARYGGDENAFVIIEMRRDGKKDLLRVIYVSTTERKSITDSCRRIEALHDQFNFMGIMIDSSGVGGGLYDLLTEKSRYKRIVTGLENAKRTVDKDGRKGKIFKEDLYSNAIVLMEKEPPVIDIISNLKLLKSLKSMTYEYTSDRNLKIFGKYSHIAEAFVRACWCVKTKHLKLYCA
ncbi:MAG: terminase family protein [Bacteroidota bacterium]|nr:terminase family protein [Bacteroidota bacterium]